ncbi:IS4 family transposase [Breznakiellaceae bacterium SP9]
MIDGNSFNMAEEFRDIDFNEKRLEKRFIKTMETLSKEPQKTIYGSSTTRAEAKAIYRLLSNDKFNEDEVLKAHRAATIRRISNEAVILAVQDTTSVNYDTRKKMKGNGYMCEQALGVNIHSCLAVTPEGLVMGLPAQKGFNRAEPKNTTLTKEEQRNRPIEEKESFRWLETMGNADAAIAADTKVIHVCDREGDIYELFDKAIQSGRFFLIRIVQDRMTVENEKILDKIRGTLCEARIEVRIPRDSRGNMQERDTVLEIRYARYEIKKPQLLNKNKTLLPSLTVNVIYVKEEPPPQGVEAIEWFLMTNEEAASAEAAYEKVKYYMQRWKIERFHFVLKSGCKIEELQERSMDKMKALILMYSVIAVYIMNLTYIARINPDLPCSIVFEEAEWKILYCAANRTKKVPDKPYTIKQAVDYVGWLGGPKRAPSDGPPGLKTIWTGLQKLYMLMDYHELFDFLGQG